MQPTLGRTWRFALAALLYLFCPWTSGMSLAQQGDEYEFDTRIPREERQHEKELKKKMEDPLRPLLIEVVIEIEDTYVDSAGQPARSFDDPIPPSTTLSGHRRLLGRLADQDPKADSTDARACLDQFGKQIARVFYGRRGSEIRRDIYREAWGWNRVASVDSLYFIFSFRRVLRREGEGERSVLVSLDGPQATLRYRLRDDKSSWLLPFEIDGCRVRSKDVIHVLARREKRHPDGAQPILAERSPAGR